MSNISYLGTGPGYIYVTDSTATVPQFPALANTPANVRAILKEMVVSTAVISGTRGSFKIEISAVAAPGDILTVVVDGVSQISAPVAATVGNPALTAYQLATEINSTVPASGPNYTAVASGGIVFVFTPTATDAQNGDVVSVTADVSITFTADASVEGGALANAGISPVWGRRVWFDLSGTTTAITGTEITSQLLSVLYGRPQRIQQVTWSLNSISVERDGDTTYVEVDSGGVLQPLSIIASPGFTTGDRLVIWGRNAANSIQAISFLGSPDNIYTDSDASFNSEGAQEIITLMLIDDATLGLNWFELSRSSQHPVSISELNAGGVLLPVSGTQTDSVILGGGSINLVSGTDKENLILQGSGDLLANFSVTGGFAIDGNSFRVWGYQTAINYAGGSLIIMGQTVPEELALSGQWYAQCLIESGTWSCAIIPYANAPLWIQDSMIFDVSGAKITADSIPTAAYAPLSVTGAKVADGTLTVNKLDASTQAALASAGVLYSSSRTFTPAEVIALFATPEVVIPAPGAGKRIDLVSAFNSMTFATTAYAPSAAMTLRFSGSGQEIAWDDSGTLPAIADASSKFLFLTNGAANADQLPENVALECAIDAAALLGDSDVTLYLCWRVIG